MKHLRFCMMEAGINCKEYRHPQIVMKDLGITYQQSTPQSMGDQWWFWNCENLPNELPTYLKDLIDYKTKEMLNPMDCIGYGLSLEDAEKIMNYKKSNMKSKEEIEQLAKEEYKDNLHNPFFTAAPMGYIKGYTQCQEDNADKKYTKEDIIKAIEIGVNAEAGDYPKGFSYKLGISLEDYFINSLNKED